MSTSSEIPNRRPIKSRSHPLAHTSATWLAKHGVSPNTISIFSILFAAAGALALLKLPHLWGSIICAAMIQLRLICNLLDGMVAVEGGRKTPVGALYNEIPDRLADTLLIVALGYAVAMPWLGWLGALAAALTAYIRTLGGAIGLEQDFRGPMAKQQRMAILTLACLAGVIESTLTNTRYSLLLSAWIIAIGSLLTCYTRTRAIAQQLNRQT